MEKLIVFCLRFIHLVTKNYAAVLPTSEIIPRTNSAVKVDPGGLGDHFRTGNQSEMDGFAGGGTQHSGLEGVCGVARMIIVINLNDFFTQIMILFFHHRFSSIFIDFREIR